MYSKPLFTPWVAAAQGIQVLAHLAAATQRPKSKYGEQIVAALGYISEYAEQIIDYTALARKLGVRTQPGWTSGQMSDAIARVTGDWYE